jgi:hypothetical protein
VAVASRNRQNKLKEGPFREVKHMNVTTTDDVCVSVAPDIVTVSVGNPTINGYSNRIIRIFHVFSSLSFSHLIVHCTTYAIETAL